MELPDLLEEHKAPLTAILVIVILSLLFFSSSQPSEEYEEEGPNTEYPPDYDMTVDIPEGSTETYMEREDEIYGPDNQAPEAEDPEVVE